VAVLSLLTMIAEVIVGHYSHSLALTTEGWHQGTHVGSLAVSVFAYWCARKYGHRFSFGSGKLLALAAFTNALVLAMIALEMVVEGVGRLIHPEAIAIDQALIVACVGLVVNLAAFGILRGARVHDHHHYHLHAHARHDDHSNHEHQRADINFRSATVHLLADAATSSLAIVALGGARIFGLNFLDPVMAIVSALVIAQWSYSLLLESGRTLLDLRVDKLEEQLRQVISKSSAEIVDMHVWPLGDGRHAAVISVRSEVAVDQLKEQIRDAVHIEHLTIETVPEASA
jgi:cation diffusion facilitator family transporter